MFGHLCYRQLLLIIKLLFTVFFCFISLAFLLLFFGNIIMKELFKFCSPVGTDVVQDIFDVLPDTGGA